MEPLCLSEGANVGPHYWDMAVTEEGIVGARGGAYQDRDWVAHMGALRVRRKLGLSVWRQYAKIAVVRNPYDRMVSMFWWRLSNNDRVTLADAPFDSVKSAFGNWLVQTDAGKNTGKLCIGPRYCLNYVLYFERLDAEVSALFQILGVQQPELPRYKSGARLRSEPWSEYYCVTTDRIIKRQSGFELAFFGYDLHGGPYRQTAKRRATQLLRLSPGRISNALRHPRSPLEITSDPLDHSGPRD